jgi:hypothetical protein
MKWRCLNKVKIKTAKAAKVAARRRPGRAWYFCDNCHYFHVGGNL